MESFIYFILGVLVTILVGYIFRFKFLDIIVQFAEITKSKEHAKWIANIAVITKNNKKAITLYKKAISLGDDRIQTIMNLSGVYLKERNTQESIKYIDKVIDKIKLDKLDNKKLSKAYLQKFNILFGEEDINEKDCEYYLLESINLDSNIFNYNNATAFYRTVGNITLANKYLDNIEKIDSESFYYIYNKAFILRRENKHEESLSFAIKAHKLDPLSEDIKNLCRDLCETITLIEETGGLPLNKEESILVKRLVVDKAESLE